MDSSFEKTLAELKVMFLTHELGGWLCGERFDRNPRACVLPTPFLKRECDADKPDALWSEVSGRMANALQGGIIKASPSNPLDLLQQFFSEGIPLHDLSLPDQKQWTRNAIGCLQDFCRPSVEVRILEFKRDRMLVFLKEGDKIHIWIVQDGEGQTLIHRYAEVSWHDVLHALLYLWAEHGTNWKQARSKLCDLFEQAANLFRAQQSAAFDAAVAVSQNGSTIVCADEVLIMGLGQYWHLRPSAFRDTKIILDPSYEERAVQFSDAVSQVLEALLKVSSLNCQGLVRLAKPDGQQLRIFIAAPKHCSPELLKTAGISLEE